MARFSRQSFYKTNSSGTNVQCGNTWSSNFFIEPCFNDLPLITTSIMGYAQGHVEMCQEVAVELRGPRNGSAIPFLAIRSQEHWAISHQKDRTFPLHQINHNHPTALVLTGAFRPFREEGYASLQSSFACSCLAYDNINPYSGHKESLLTCRH